MVNNQYVKSQNAWLGSGPWTLTMPHAPMKSGRRPTTEQGVWGVTVIISP